MRYASPAVLFMRLKQINVTIEKQPTAEAYMLRARLWVHQEKLPEAIKDLEHLYI